MAKEKPIKVQTHKQKKDSTDNSQQKVDKLSGKHKLRVLAHTLLNAYDKDARLKAAYEIGKIRDPQAIEILEKALKIEKDQEVLTEIINALNWLIGDNLSEALIDFFLNSQDAYLSRKAVLVLGRTADPKILEALKAKMRQEIDPEVKITSLKILSNFVEEEVLKILGDRLFADPHPEVRKVAAITLGKFAHPGSSEILLQALEEIMEKELRQEIIWALSKRDNLEIKNLLPHFHNEPNLENQKMILWLIGQRGKIDDLADLVKSFDYPLHDDLQKDLILSFGKFKDKLSGDQLIEIFEKAQSSRIRHQALWSLSGVMEKKHLPKLMKIKEQEEDPYLREELAEILRIFSGK